MKDLTRLAATTLALVVGSATLGARADAQDVTEVSRTAIADAAQITFGYLCDDRFVIRNDGTKAIDLEYAVEKGTEHTKLSLGAREAVELSSKSKRPIELWMDGKLIAKAMKEKRSCKDVQGNAAVSVAPLEVNAKERQRPSYYGYGAPYPFYDPWSYYFYGPFGYRPYFSGFVSYPIIIGGGGMRGGRRGH